MDSDGIFAWTSTPVRYQVSRVRTAKVAKFVQPGRVGGIGPGAGTGHQLPERGGDDRVDQASRGARDEERRIHGTRRDLVAEDVIGGSQPVASGPQPCRPLMCSVSEVLACVEASRTLSLALYIEFDRRVPSEVGR